MQKIILIFILSASLFALSHFSNTQKQKYLYPLGEKIHHRLCPNLKAEDFSTLQALYEHIERTCNLSEERYNVALAYYLWDGVKQQKKERVSLGYTKKDKCPVCGMFIYKYPKWATMAIEKNGKKLYFDGVKDMLKYYFAHQKNIQALYAQDYYTKKLFNLKTAFLVLGSDVYGPMGDELIPFSSEADAKSFMQEHKGEKIVRLEDLNLRTVEALDE